MSGGHYDYRYASVREVSELVEEESGQQKVWMGSKECLESRPAEEVKDRLRMAEVLRRVSEAMRALEWYDSGDSGDWEGVKKTFENIHAKT